jgi:hypothetical protein
MLKYVLEYRVFINRVVPLDGLIEHHDEEPIDRLREEQLAQTVGRKRHGKSAAQYAWLGDSRRSGARRGAL